VWDIVTHGRETNRLVILRGRQTGKKKDGLMPVVKAVLGSKQGQNTLSLYNRSEPVGRGKGPREKYVRVWKVLRTIRGKGMTRREQIYFWTRAGRGHRKSSEKAW